MWDSEFFLVEVDERGIGESGDDARKGRGVAKANRDIVDCSKLVAKLWGCRRSSVFRAFCFVGASAPLQRIQKGVETCSQDTGNVLCSQLGGRAQKQRASRIKDLL